MVWRMGGVDPPWWWRPWLRLADRPEREALADLAWRLFWCRYTSWRQDRAFRRWQRAQS